MRTVTTQHTDYARDHSGQPAARRALNVEYLLRLLEYTHSSPRNGNRKKRSLSDAAPTPDRQRKRFKKANATDAEKGGLEDGDEVVVEPSLVPVYRHTLHIKHALDEQEQKEEGKQLYKWLKMSGQEDNGWSTAINGVKLTSSSSSAYVYVDNQSMSLLEVPNVDPTFNVEEHDFRHMPMRDPLFACSVLQDAGRAQLSAEMAVRVEQAVNDSVLSLGITLDISVSLIFPTISEPTLYATKIATSEAEEAQRRAMHYIFPPQVQQSAPQSHMDVASLYATLGPAPQLNPPSLQANYQPYQLLPTLLPFQRRSVAWLLSREGKAINDSLDVVDRNVDAELPLFWQKVPVKAADGTEQELYVNDLTGAVSTTKPSDDSPRGGVLAEEPGLGKTLESIALVLLNPAIGRNPSNKSWNADARIFMKEVKVCCVSSTVEYVS